ncbi:MAG: sulfatase-like hydrolase/transferase, partial [Bacteroidota bacterium]
MRLPTTWALCLLLLVPAAGLSTRSLPPEDPPRNVLFIAMDDLRIQLGCFGQSYMKTPHIDRLAAEGVAFRHAYCQQSICMASRASIMSGLRPEHRKLYNCSSLEDLAPEVVTLNEHFAAHGYQTAAIGKVYHHQADHLAQFGEAWHDPTGQWAGRGYLSDEAIAEMMANGRFSAEKKPKGPAYEMADVPDSHYIDGANAEQA